MKNKIPDAISLDKFKDMDYQAISKYGLPIELMMENAGYQLAKRAAEHLTQKESSVMIGVGNGNNGGGGLVAARRLAAWGFKVAIETFTEINKPLPVAQLERALKFGAKIQALNKVDVYIDAFLGFSQRPPLPKQLIKKLKAANESKAIKIALDIPTGINIDNIHAFKPDIIVTMAAMKDVLMPLVDSTKIYIADIGIPKTLYNLYGIKQPNFNNQIN